MKFRTWVWTIGATVLISLWGCACAQGAQATKHVEDDTVPTVPMTPKDIQRCGMSILTPKLLGTPYATNCSSGNWKGPPTEDGPANGMVGTGFVVGYKTGNGPSDGEYSQQAAQALEWSVYGVDIDGYFKHVVDNTLSRSPDGLITMQVIPGCHDSGKQKDVPISGSNWKGYLIEEVDPPHEKLSAACPVPTPMYRCVGMIIGNAKETAVLNPYCFLAKREDNLYHGLSFDIFMDMVRTIHFVEQ